MTKQEITLQDILAAKEIRHNRQKEIRQIYQKPLVSITINMPGAVKDTPIIRRLREYAVKEIQRNFNSVMVEQVNNIIGPEAFIVLDAEGWLIKKTAVEIEERHPFGRLLDIDVFEADGRLLSRRDDARSRGCFVCGGEAVVCMRERKHTPQELQQVVEGLLASFCAYETRTVSAVAEKLGALAVEAMLYEVTCTPAPGLVDRANSGAHCDMDFYSFMASSARLALPMARCAQAGLSHQGDIEHLLPVLRMIGVEGEAVMLAATGNINTQKGILFLLGIMTGVTGWLIGQQRPVTSENVLTHAAQMVTGIVEKELTHASDKKPEQRTGGENLYLQYGVTGIRGELADGLPAVRKKALPALRAALKKGLSINNALVHTLFVLMTCVDDTTVMHRHHPDKMRIWVRQHAEEILASEGVETLNGKKKCEAIDKLFIQHNVSPGGVADLLAVTWFLYRL